MAQAVSQKIKALEGEIGALREHVERLWAVIDDELLWRPQIVRTILKRSREARKLHRARSLRTAQEFFRSLAKNA